ncbi:MAG: hypothetical protein HGA65_09755 [Oscillochloris sp.]|nr:hypothetical protein [Oscillochloris sp.]
MRRIIVPALLTLALAACGTSPQAAAPSPSLATATAAAFSPTPTQVVLGASASTATPEVTSIPVAPTGISSLPSPLPTRPLPSLDQVTMTATDTIVGEVPADLLAKIIADAAERSGVEAANIVVQKGQAIEWSDSSLGCPQPDMAYMQVITPGYQVLLQVGASTYDYHANTRGYFLLCPVN